MSYLGTIILCLIGFMAVRHLMQALFYTMQKNTLAGAAMVMSTFLSMGLVMLGITYFTSKLFVAGSGLASAAMLISMGACVAGMLYAAVEQSRSNNLRGRKK